MTDVQRRGFFNHLHAAVRAQKVPFDKVEEYRHDLIRRAVPHSGGSTKGVNNGDDFDRLMYLTCVEGNDFESAARWSLAPGERVAKMVEAMAEQVFQLSKSAGNAATYLQGIIKQAGWNWALYAKEEGWWLDLTLPHLHRLMMMLDAHRRRLIKRAVNTAEVDAQGNELRTPMRLAFDIGAEYRWEGERLLRRPKVKAERTVTIRIVKEHFAPPPRVRAR